MTLPIASMMIADAQVHIWRATTPERPWPSGARPQRAEPLGQDELLNTMNEVGVARAILVPPRIEGGRNDLSLDAATAHPDRFAVMGKLDQDAPDAREKLASWRDHPGMLGLRFILQHTLQSTVQFLSAVRHDVYRGDALAVPRGLGVDHGPRALRVVGLEIS